MGWSRLARAYDWQLPLQRAALAAAVKFADPRPGDALLDPATGTDGRRRLMFEPAPDIRSWVREAREDDAPRLSRRQRREEKQRRHNAQKKARAIDKANDKQRQASEKQGIKNKDKKQKKGK